MKNLAFYISIACLLLTLVPSFFVYTGHISLELNKTLMLAGTIGWFCSAPFWMNRNKNEDISEVYPNDSINGKAIKHNRS